MPITQYNSSVRQMSQSKFNSMKNASGKIPDLANQIVMTNSEDSNTSCLRTEVVYDMTSSDASKNWGYPNGIGTGVTINKDFSKYDFLVCQYLSYNNSIVGFCDLRQPTMPSDTTGRYMLYAVAYIGNAYSELISVIDLNKSSLTTYLPGSGNLAVKIAKIYGILKTPSMIYTGDELIAGNGISIKNGVISGIKSEIVWSGNFAYLATEQTMSLDLSKYKYVEFMTTTGNILPMNLQDTRPNGDLYVYLNASSYYNGSWHDGVKCEGAYYYGTKQIKWSGNYCGLAQVRGYWW